tara:strand:- start:558 stop:797 length:240 start_codon:yes stop_codon:yes gene_type:complete
VTSNHTKIKKNFVGSIAVGRALLSIILRVVFGKMEVTRTIVFGKMEVTRTIVVGCLMIFVGAPVVSHEMMAHSHLRDHT